MSFYCRVANPPILLKTLSAISLDRDSWSTVIFTDTAVVMLVEGNDRTATASGMIPKEVFEEYVVSDTRFTVHLASFVDALLLLGVATLTAPSTRVTIMFPTSDAKLLVELSEHSEVCPERPMGRALGSVPGEGRTLQSRLVTRPFKDSILDLHFRDSLIEGQAMVLGSPLRDVIQDLMVASCTETVVSISPQQGVQLIGEHGRYGEVDILLQRRSEVVLSIDDTRGAERVGRTRVSTAKLAQACGLRTGAAGGGTARGGGRAGGGGGVEAMWGSAGGGGIPGSSGGFERLLLQINAERQLSVMHMPRDDDVKVVATVVLSPCYDYEEL